MLKSLTFLSLAATLTVANAQSAAPAPLVGSDQTQPPAPILRSYQQRRARHQADQIVESQPVSGVWLRSEAASVVKTIAATPQRAEIRLDRGRLNVSVHHPAEHAEILIDLPGGQISLFKDGLYTFNADTNTVRVLRGEAAAYPGPISTTADVKPIKVKEDHQLSLVAPPGLKAGDIRSVEAYSYEITADLLPPDNHGDRAYAGGGYGDSYEPDYPRYEYPYPYYAGAWGYPGFYPGYYGYPFAYGIGFGYYGGFRGGYGYRGGFRR